MNPPTFDGSVRRALLGRRILVAESDDSAAQSITVMLHSSGCAVVGPVATTHRSVDLVRNMELDGAIVAFELRDRTATPLMDELSARSIPFLLTASRPAREVVADARPYLLLQTPLLLPQVQTALARMLA